MRVLILSIVEPDAKVGAGMVTRGLLDRWRAEWPEPREIRIVANRLGSVGHVRWRRGTCILRGALTGRASKILFQENADALKAARRANADGPWDLLVVNGADMLGIALGVMRMNTLPLWIVVHNIEADLFREQIEGLPVWLRWLFRGDLLRMEREESAGFAAADRLICICEEDRDRIRQLHPDLRAEVDVAPLRFSGTPYCERAESPTGGGPLRLGMLGNFAWWPNARGLDWFHREVWPRLPENVELHLFGGQSIEAARTRGSRVRGWGSCETLDEVWSRVDLMICPVRHGGGVRIKNAEAVWNGVPLITNRLGLRGIVDRPRAPVIVCETAEEWATALRDLATRRNDA